MEKGQRSWISLAVGFVAVAAVAGAGYAFRAGRESARPVPAAPGAAGPHSVRVTSAAEAITPNLSTTVAAGAPRSLAHPLIGKQMPAVTLPLLGGGTQNLADYRGKKIILNFWTTW